MILMALYDILANRPCIWILKQLYDQETAEKKVYTMNLSKIGEKTGLKEKAARFVLILSENKLVHIDDVENDKVICLTQKGKDFFKQFERLKIVFEGKEEIMQKKMVRIEYDLTELEKRTLIMAYRMGKETGGLISVKDLIKEMYPYENNSKKTAPVSKNIAKLVKLNLLSKTKIMKENFISLTDAGKRTIKEQLIEMLSQQLE